MRWWACLLSLSDSKPTTKKAVQALTRRASFGLCVVMLGKQRRKNAASRILIYVGFEILDAMRWGCKPSCGPMLAGRDLIIDSRYVVCGLIAEVTKSWNGIAWAIDHRSDM